MHSELDSATEYGPKGRNSMVNTGMLNKLIGDSGLKLSAIMEKMNIKAYETLRAKIENRRDFTASEIEKLSAILGLNMEQREEIFFAKDAEYHSA